MKTLSSVGSQDMATVTISSTTEGDMMAAMMSRVMMMTTHMAISIKQRLRIGQTEVWHEQERRRNVKNKKRSDEI